MLCIRIALLFLLVVACYGAKEDKCNKKTKDKCLGKGGICISSKKKCEGEEFKGKKYCKSEDKCKCCVEDKPTTPKPTTKKPTTKKPTTPEPTTTTTTPEPTTTTPEPTTPTPLPPTSSTAFWSASSPFWSDSSYGPSSPGPSPEGDSCYSPADGTTVPTRTEVNGPCQTFICTMFGWVPLDIWNPFCCTAYGFDGQKSWPNGTILYSSMLWNALCSEGEWINQHDEIVFPGRRGFNKA